MRYPTYQTYSIPPTHPTCSTYKIQSLFTNPLNVHFITPFRVNRYSTIRQCLTKFYQLVHQRCQGVTFHNHNSRCLVLDHNGARSLNTTQFIRLDRRVIRGRRQPNIRVLTRNPMLYRLRYRNRHPRLTIKNRFPNQRTVRHRRRIVSLQTSRVSTTERLTKVSTLRVLTCRQFKHLYSGSLIR